MLRPLGVLVCVGIPNVTFKLPATPFDMIVKGNNWSTWRLIELYTSLAWLTRLQASPSLAILREPQRRWTSCSQWL